METKTWQKTTFMFIILLALGGAIAGTFNSKQYILMHEDCYDLADNNNDGDEDLGVDMGCSEYPYQDGNGEDGTSLSNRWTQPTEDYQTGYDIMADFIQSLIFKTCSGDASTCGVPGVSDEVELFCWYESNTAGATFTQMAQAWAISTGKDDGSYQMIQDLCYQFGGSGLTELPVINFQQFENLND